jgi:hypothetical protein
LKGNTLSTKATSFLAAASKCLTRISTKRIFQVINPEKNSSLVLSISHFSSLIVVSLDGTLKIANAEESW